MKVAFDEPVTWETGDVSPEIMKVLPVNFTTEHKQMLSHFTRDDKQGLFSNSKTI